MRRGRLLLAACMWVATPVAADAQSLQELYDAARGYDAAVLGARALAESAQYRVDQVHALRRPNLGLSATAARTVGDAPVSSTRNRAATGTLSAVQPLFNPVNDATIAQADRSLDAAQADLELAEQDLIVRLAQDYFDVLGAQDALATTRANKRAIAQQREAARRNYEVGTATITDVREAQARFDLATSDDIAADNDLTIRRIALDELVGRRGIAPWRLQVPVSLPTPTPDSVDDWVARTDSSPTVRRAIVVSDIARLETEKSRAQNLPTVELDGSYSIGTGRLLGTQALTSSGQQLDAALPVDVHGRTTNANINVLVRVPLFAGFAVQDRIRETLLLEDQARYALDAARRVTAQSTRQAFFGVQSLRAQAAALEAAESSSRLALDATLLGYRVGVRVNIDVLNAQSQLYATQRDLAQARYGVLVNQLRLRQAAGSLAAADVAALSRLTSPAAVATSPDPAVEPLAAALIPGRAQAPTADVPAAARTSNPQPVPPLPAMAAMLEPALADGVANAFLTRWTHAWSGRDVETYAELYASDFAGRADSHAAWLAQRRARMEGRRSIAVKVSNVVVTQRPGVVVIRFDQDYAADGASEKGRKQITLRREGDRWRVVEETELR